MSYTESIQNKLRDVFGDILLQDAAYPVILPEAEDDIIKAIKWCKKNGWKVLPVGRGTNFKDNFAVPDNALAILSLKRCNISDPDTNDMVLEVECGVDANSVKEHLRNFGFKINGWPENYSGTTGGYICSPAGLQLRSVLLGVDIIDGKGNCHRFGGRIQKNVAGFDITSFIPGSNGKFCWVDRFFIKLAPLNSLVIKENSPISISEVINSSGYEYKVREAIDPDLTFLCEVS